MALSSEEIAALDLTGTDWAVLSACDAGIGKQSSAKVCSTCAPPTLP